MLAFKEDILVFITQLYVTYTLMGIMCVVIARVSSDITLPIKEPAVALLKNIYCFHQEYMVIRRWLL
jgi:hypothetical protein